MDKQNPSQPQTPGQGTPQEIPGKSLPNPNKEHPHD